MTETIKWEYRVQTVGGALRTPQDEDLQQMLNEWGEEGWEVVAAHHLEGNQKLRLIAKRPLSVASRRRRSWPA